MIFCSSTRSFLSIYIDDLLHLEIPLLLPLSTTNCLFFGDYHFHITSMLVFSYSCIYLVTGSNLNHFYNQYFAM